MVVAAHRYDGGMLAAPIWHWWVGLLMLGLGVLACVSMVVGYLKMVSSQRYPSGKRKAEQEL